MACSCLCIWVVLSAVDFEVPRLRRAVVAPLAAAVLLASALLLFGGGPAGSGAKVNRFGIQPVEIIRPLFVFSLAAYFARRWQHLRELAPPSVPRPPDAAAVARRPPARDQPRRAARIFDPAKGSRSRAGPVVRVSRALRRRQGTSGGGRRGPAGAGGGPVGGLRARHSIDRDAAGPSVLIRGDASMAAINLHACGRSRSAGSRARAGVGDRTDPAGHTDLVIAASAKSWVRRVAAVRR